MQVRSGEEFRTIWLHPRDESVVQVIDQRKLPHRYETFDLRSYRDGILAIREMVVRGAPLIGATAAWSAYLAALEAPARSRIDFVRQAAGELAAARPTAVNLRWAVDRLLRRMTAVGR
ncbi:MAG: S-methyl-5-thioribose-1-phosphate isomerase, partial [Gammaproteobacteria bacterium]|nr:S-methyl-5-thioribose-1-phosphate isomerase [Gammaproteobacteria bacterium]